MLDVKYDLVALHVIGTEMGNASLHDCLVFIGIRVHPVATGNFRQAVTDDRQHVVAVALEIQNAVRIGAELINLLTVAVEDVGYTSCQVPTRSFAPSAKAVGEPKPRQTAAVDAKASRCMLTIFTSLVPFLFGCPDGSLR